MRAVTLDNPSLP